MKNDYYVLFNVELDVESMIPVDNGVIWNHEESEECEKRHEGALSIITQQAKSLLPDVIKSAAKIHLKEHICDFMTKPVLKLEVVVEVDDDAVMQLSYLDWVDDLRQKLFKIFEQAAQVCERIQANNPIHPERVLVKHGQDKDTNNIIYCKDSDVLNISEKLRRSSKKGEAEQSISLMSEDGRQVKINFPNEAAITLVQNRTCFININVRSIDLDSHESRIIDVDNNRSVKLNFDLADVGKLCAVIPDGKTATCEVYEAYRYKQGKRIPIRYVLQRVVEVHEDLIAQISK